MKNLVHFPNEKNQEKAKPWEVWQSTELVQLFFRYLPNSQKKFNDFQHINCSDIRIEHTCYFDKKYILETETEFL